MVLDFPVSQSVKHNTKIKSKFYLHKMSTHSNDSSCYFGIQAKFWPLAKKSTSTEKKDHLQESTKLWS